MGFKLSKAVAANVTIPVKFPGTEDVLSVVHNTRTFTPEFEERSNEWVNDEIQSRFLYRVLIATVKSWDLEDDDGSITGTVGNMIPVDEEHLRKLPIELLVAVTTAINEYHNPVPNPTSPTSSSGSF